MRKFVFGLILMSTLILPSICNGQDEDDYTTIDASLIDTTKDPDIARYTIKDTIKADTLTDAISGNKYIIDKKKIYITAIDKKGNVLWKTDPIIDNKMGWYRVNRPTIVCVILCPETVFIGYNNTQFGYLEKNTGKFIFSGQD